MWATEIVGAWCPECDAPFTIAWRETEGRRYRYRMDVEVLMGCECDGVARTPPEFVEPEDWQ